MLARQLGLQDAVPLKRCTQPQEHKLVVFVPAENLDAVLKVAFRTCRWHLTVMCLLVQLCPPR